MFRVHSRFNTGNLCKWHECSGCESPLRLGDREAARTWLSGFLLDDAQAQNLRSATRGFGDGIGVNLRPGDGVIDELAGLIASGWLRVCERQALQDPAQGMLIDAVVGQLSSPPPPVSRTRPPPPAPPPSEPATLPAGLDAAAMAAVLAAAAAKGVPFCEICDNTKQPAPSAQTELADTV